MMWTQSVFERANYRHFDFVLTGFAPSRHFTFPRRGLDVTGFVPVDRDRGDAAAPIRKNNKVSARGPGEAKILGILHAIGIKRVALL